MTTMPWGKHRGERLPYIPIGYLVWVLEQGYADRTPPLRAAIRAEVADRLALFPPPPPPPLWGRVGAPPADLAPMLGALVDVGFKTLALRAHPDRGGCTADMQTLNALREWLRGQGWAS